MERRTDERGQAMVEFSPIANGTLSHTVTMRRESKG
jgi:hypothetical protein